MKNLSKKIICLVLLFAVSLSTLGCGKDDDSDKAVLHVYSFTSGFGSEWLTSLIADYEKAKENDQIDGKKGIKINPTALKSDVDGSQMAGKDEVIYFLEQQDYYELLAGNYIADITEAITGVNPYDGKTLESKMFDHQKSYFARTVNGETRYFAYPHYFTTFGIAYDVELFDTKGYYFADGYDKNGNLSDMFLGTVGVIEGWAKTKGPDQTSGTSDDGLPTTYEEFLLLCDYIATIGNDNPLIWAGQFRESYLTHFIAQLAADYEGYDQMMLNYTFDGTAKNLGSAVGNDFVFDKKDTVIDGSNGAELARQAGKYYAMDFYRQIYGKSYIVNADTERMLFSSSYSHLRAQEDFLKRGTTRNAMLLDGSWWQTEASSTFTIMGNINSAYSKQNRKIGWMPLPKQSEEKVGEKSTMFDIMYPLLVMKNGLDKNSWQYKYALDFIQFANSDEQLAKFTKITGCTKSLNYTLTADQYKNLSYYGKTFYDAYVKADKVFPYANNLIFANNQDTFNEICGANGSAFFMSTACTDKYATYVMGVENGAKLSEYFNGIYTYFNSLENVWKKITD